jgi:hypothetical protein
MDSPKLVVGLSRSVFEMIRSRFRPAWCPLLLVSRTRGRWTQQAVSIGQSLKNRKYSIICLPHNNAAGEYEDAYTVELNEPHLRVQLPEE